MDKEKLEQICNVGDLVRVTTTRRYNNIITGISFGVRNDRSYRATDGKPWWRLHLLINASDQPKHTAIPLDEIVDVEVACSIDDSEGAGTQNTKGTKQKKTVQTEPNPC